MVIFAAGRTETDAGGRKSRAGSRGKSVQLVHGMRPGAGRGSPNQP